MNETSRQRATMVPVHPPVTSSAISRRGGYHHGARCWRRGSFRKGRHDTKTSPPSKLVVLVREFIPKAEVAAMWQARAEFLAGQLEQGSACPGWRRLKSRRCRRGHF